MSPKTALRAALERVETVFDAAFTPALNPLYQLGALGWFFYWIVAVSGIYLYVFFDTGVKEAYVGMPTNQPSPVDSRGAVDLHAAPSPGFDVRQATARHRPSPCCQSR